MICRTFFHFSQTGESASSANPQDMSTAQVWTELVEHLTTDDDYIGLMDADDNVLQISQDSANASYRLEVVLTDSRASLAGILSPEELKELLEHLPSRFKPSAFPDFAQQEWQVNAG